MLICFITVFLQGCLTLKMESATDGLDFSIGWEMPQFDFTKDIGSENNQE